MKICRFLSSKKVKRIGLLYGENHVLDLTAGGVRNLTSLLEKENLPEILIRLKRGKLPRYPLDQIKLLAPIERQEIWAAGVTYLRSKKARMVESTFSADAYDRVYHAKRPEIFFKSLPEKVVGPEEPVGIRMDAKWNVPEPELGLVINSRGSIVGYTIGNDMSSRDIEGENLLYLPQAKIYHRSCAIGPYIAVGCSEREARAWRIELKIIREEEIIFEGQTSVSQMKRSFKELINYLYRCQIFPHGVVLLTGTGIVPDNEFNLKPKDRIMIKIDGIGVLENTVIQV